MGLLPEEPRNAGRGGIDTRVVVVGAGPAGLAAAACLQRARVPHLLLERATTVGSAWRKHYDRLHLHTSRAFSSLPFRAMPRSYPRYPSRAQVVEYLESYVAGLDTQPRTGVEVTRVERRGDGWVVHTPGEALACREVVLATGANGTPRRPTWPGLDTFPGTVLHSSEYRNGSGFRGSDILVVGFGNSGGEIALDLLEHGARPVLAVRSPVNIIPRDVGGVPVLAIAIPLAKLPARLADLLIWPILKAYYPSYARLGLRQARLGPFRQIAARGRIPLLDIGTVREIRRGRIPVEDEVADLDGPEVRFRSGHTRRFGGIVLATGYEPALPVGVEAVPGPEATPSAPGLYGCGFYVSPTGMLREIGLEARRIARNISRRLDTAS